jgi:uncharacterized SAM-binding protein YcdF (DUF218 family)
LYQPLANTDRTRFDAIVVLGSPADSDGNPTPDQLQLVTEGVREYERGVAPRLILSGGPTRKNFVEAEVMARSARAMGVPASAILVEGRSMNTIENARFSVRLLEDHQGRTAEVVAEAAHMPRAALIFSRLPIDFRMHAAPPLQPRSFLYHWSRTLTEVLKTARYLVWARWVVPWQPREE